MPRIIDISLPITAGGLVYPGNPAIEIEAQQSIAAGGSSNVSFLRFGSHTGTHVDAPKHMLEHGAGVDSIPLDALIGPAVVLAFGDDVMAIGADHLRPHDLSGAERVLLRTRNSAFVHSPEFVREYTYLAPDGAEYLRSLGVRLVGIDYLSIEQFHSGHHRSHRTLLGAGIVIVEGLDLSHAAPGVYQLHCLPLRIAGGDGAPARAVLVA